MPLSLKARRDFIEGVVPLSLWLARKLNREGMPLFEALTVRTNLYRMTVLFDGKNHPATGFKDERWNEAAADLQRIYDRHKDDADSGPLEREGWERLRLLVEPRIEADARGWPKPEERPFGFFTYEFARPKNGSSRIDLHLANPFVPESPFANPGARAAELMRLLSDAKAKQPEVETVHCGSWLNALKPFQELFPPEWAANMTAPSELRYHYGWWGQFIDRTGGFNRRNGDKLRATGVFPFPCVGCQCSVASLRKHLEKMFGIRGL